MKSEQRLTGARAIVAYLFSDDRNSYHSSRSFLYDLDSIFFDVESLKFKANERSVQGTKLHLDVLPAIELSFGTSKAFWIEVNSRQPFRYANIGLTSISWLRQVGRTDFQNLALPESEIWNPPRDVFPHVYFRDFSAPALDLYVNQCAQKSGARQFLQIGEYVREFDGSTSYGDRKWDWQPITHSSGKNSISRRWFDRMVGNLQKVIYV